MSISQKRGTPFWCVTVMAIVGITVLGSVGLLTGHDGKLLTGMVATLAALGGVAGGFGAGARANLLHLLRDPACLAAVLRALRVDPDTVAKAEERAQDRER